MATRPIRDFLIGPPLPTQRLSHEKLDSVRALAALSPDALSSIAYANQEIFLGLAVAGAAGLVLSWRIALAIAALLGIVAVSYTQTIHAYPSGGGSYAVARENLGQIFGLIAAAALLIDYTLTSAVSLTAGVAQIASAFPVLWPFRTELALVLLFVITVANLRGVRETGTLMSIPVYLFVLSYLGMLGYGAILALREGPGSFAQAAPAAIEPLTLFLILHTFSSGCTALTGVEAISNGVPIFKPPESRNASRVMIVMAGLMVVLFLGSNFLTQHLAVVAGPEETILSALARRILGSGVLYVIVQAGVMLVLLVAANTSFAGFPRLASILAQDGYAPRQLAFLGDRLVFQNGMLVLAGLTALLIVAFGGDAHALIPLFAVGVFIAFTLSQAGMVIHWFKEKGRGWQGKALVNGVGAVVTFVTLLVVGVSKFLEGAFIVIFLIPALVGTFFVIHQHYQHLARDLSLKDYGAPPRIARHRVIMTLSGIHRGSLAALRYARALSDDVTALYVSIDPAEAEKVRERWEIWGEGVRLVVLDSPYRVLIGPLLEYIECILKQRQPDETITIVVPQFVPRRWLANALHTQTATWLRLALLFKPGIVITNVPYQVD
jgi:amino acid transporter